MRTVVVWSLSLKLWHRPATVNYRYDRTVIRTSCSSELLSSIVIVIAKNTLLRVVDNGYTTVIAPYFEMFKSEMM